MSAIAPPSGAAGDYPPLRNRALIGVITCAFARIGAVVAMPMASCRQRWTLLRRLRSILTINSGQQEARAPKCPTEI
jgi:hypothetical protein